MDLATMDPGLSADEALLLSALSATVSTVSGGRPSALQSHTARAWTMGGDVD